MQTSHNSSDMAPQVVIGSTFHQVDFINQHGTTSTIPANSPANRMLKRPATEQSAPVGNKNLIDPKKPRNHYEALSAIKEAHRMRCKQHLDKQKSLRGYIVLLETKRDVISNKQVDNLHSELGDIAAKLENAQAQLKTSFEQVSFENENLNCEINQYVAQNMTEKDFNQDILQLIGHVSPPNTRVVSQPEQTVGQPMPCVNVDQSVPVPGEQENVPDSVKNCVAHLKEMLIASDQQLKTDKYQRQVDLRIANITNRLEMIDYVKKNLTPEQLTDEILDILEIDPTNPKSSKNPEVNPFDKRIRDLEALIRSEHEENKTASKIKDTIDRKTDLMNRQLTVKRNLEKAEEYKKTIFYLENDLKIIAKDVRMKRRIYAAQYIQPQQRIDFILDSNLPAYLAELVADARNKTRVAMMKTLVDRLKKLTKNLWDEYHQVCASMQSTSTPVNVPGRSDTFSTRNNFVVQVVRSKH